MINEVTFYGGHIICMQGPIKAENLDFILDLIDEYIELTERQDMRGDKYANR